MSKTWRRAHSWDDVPAAEGQVAEQPAVAMENTETTTNPADRLLDLLLKFTTELSELKATVEDLKADIQNSGKELGKHVDQGQRNVEDTVRFEQTVLADKISNMIKMGQADVDSWCETIDNNDLIRKEALGRELQLLRDTFQAEVKAAIQQLAPQKKSLWTRFCEWRSARATSRAEAKAKALEAQKRALEAELKKLGIVC